MGRDLLKSLDPLTRDGVIDRATAEAIRAWAGQGRSAAGGRRATLVLGVLGTALLLLGLILLLAHNWQSLGRPLRLVLSLSPLLLAQGLAFYSLRRASPTAALREASAIAVSLTSGLSLALVSQTYHIPGSFESFLTWWVVLALPAAAVLKSDAAMLLILAGVMTLGLLGKGEKGFVSFYALFPLFLALALWRVQTVGRQRAPLATGGEISGATMRQVGLVTRRVYTWALALCLPLLLVILTPEMSEAWLLPAFASLAALYAMLGMNTALFGEGLFENPFRVIGIPAVMIWVCLGSVPDLAKEFARPEKPSESWSLLYMMVGPALVILGSLGLFIFSVVKRRGMTALWGGFGVVFLAMWVSGVFRADKIFTLFGFNLYLLALGSALVVASIRKSSLWLLNGGVLLLVTQGLIWLLQGDISFTLRGLGFMAAGALLLVLNLWMARRRKKSGVAS